MTALAHMQMLLLIAKSVAYVFDHTVYQKFNTCRLNGLRDQLVEPSTRR